MKNIKRSLSNLLVLFASLTPLVKVQAQSGSIGDNPSNEGTIGNNPGTSFGLQNPLGDQTLLGFLQDILNVIMVFAVPLIVFMIIYAGFLFVMDRGSDKTLGQAKRALLYAIIGGLLILGAQVILAVIQGTVDAFRL